MQTKECTRPAACCDRKRNEEIIGILIAISIVSRRLACRIAALERLESKISGGGNCYDSRKSAATR